VQEEDGSRDVRMESVVPVGPAAHDCEESDGRLHGLLPARRCIEFSYEKI